MSDLKFKSEDKSSAHVKFLTGLQLGDQEFKGLLATYGATGTVSRATEAPKKCFELSE